MQSKFINKRTKFLRNEDSRKGLTATELSSLVLECFEGEGKNNNDISVSMTRNTVFFYVRG